MSDQTVSSITLYGEIDSSSSSWLRWYEDAKAVTSYLGYECNYISIESTSLHSGKVHKTSVYEKRLLRAIESGDEVEWVGVMSLPSDYSCAGFDYDVYLERNSAYVNITTNKSDFDSADTDALLDVLRRHVALKEGEIYEMDREECPFVYAAKDHAASFFHTLKIIRKLS